MLKQNVSHIPTDAPEIRLCSVEFRWHIPAHCPLSVSSLSSCAVTWSSHRTGLFVLSFSSPSSFNRTSFHHGRLNKSDSCWQNSRPSYVSVKSLHTFYHSIPWENVSKPSPGTALHRGGLLSGRKLSCDCNWHWLNNIKGLLKEDAVGFWYFILSTLWLSKSILSVWCVQSGTTHIQMLSVSNLSRAGQSGNITCRRAASLYHQQYNEALCFTIAIVFKPLHVGGEAHVSSRAGRQETKVHGALAADTCKQTRRDTWCRERCLILHQPACVKYIA